jgi:hypothetical protein
MDAAFVIPIINKKVGLDPILGLVPGAGDAVALLIALYILYVGRELGMTNRHLSMMVVNIAIDAAIGSIPLVGDLFDAAWKGNLRNIALIDRFLAEQSGSATPPKRRLKAKAGQQPPGQQTIDVVAEYPPDDKS